MRSARVHVFIAIILVAVWGTRENAEAQIAVQVLDEDFEVDSIEEIGGAVWLGTDKGAYRVEGTETRRILDEDLNVTSIKEIGGAVWLRTSKGVYRVEGTEARRIPDEDLIATSIKEIGSTVWLQTSKGAYRVEGTEARRIPDEDLNVTSIGEIGGAVWLRTSKGVYRVEGTEARRIPDEDLHITSIKEIGGAVWLGTNKGAYRVERTEARRIPDEDLHVYLIEEIGGAVWLRTSKGVYRVEGTEARRILDEDLDVLSIEEIGGAVWLHTDKGTYRVEGTEARRIPDEHLDVHWIEEIGGTVWLNTNKGAYRMERTEARRIPDEDLHVYLIEEIGGAVWLRTSKGVYRVEGTEARRILDEDLYVLSIEEIGGAVWLHTDKGTYRVEGTEARRIPDEHLDVHWIEEIGGTVWLNTNKGAYRMEGTEARRIPDEDLNVTSIKEIGGAVWLGASKGAYRVEGTEARRIPDEDLYVHLIEEIGGAVWLRTSKGVYRVEGTEARRIPDEDLDVLSIEEIGGAVWLRTSKGTYRIEQNATIRVEFADESSWWKFLVQGVVPDIWISGPITPRIHYSRLPSDAFMPPYDDEHFEIIVEMDKGTFDNKLQRNKFVPPQEYYWRAGPLLVHAAVRDNWGNLIVLDPIKGWVVPGPAVLPVVILILYGLFLIAIIALAPFSGFCHGLLMNPFLRAYGSFGLIPLSLTVLPPVRHHMMQRYFRGIRNDEEFAECQKQYVVPSDDFLPENLTQRLEKRHRLLLLGRSGIGKTTLFRYLTGYFASKPKKTSLPKNIVPIFVPVARYKGEKPEAMVTAQLANFGRITDQRLAEWMIRNGGFLILFDGLNEIDEATRSLIITFVDQHWKANYFCLSSQEDYADFGQWDGKVELTTLDRGHVNTLLRRRLGDEKAQTVIAQITDELYAFCRLPQNLELTVELLLEGQELPRSREALFAAIFAPKFEKWREDGRQDYPGLLCERAYRMLRDRDPFVTTKDAHLPNEIVEFLLDKRLAMRRGTECHFRHDLIRTYLAAAHFCSRWPQLLDEDGLLVDENWRALLEFTIQRLDNAEEVRDLIYRVLVLNTALAKSLFHWLEADHPHLCENWKVDFARRFGEAMLATD